MKVYEITFNDEEKVSLVKSPAIESTLLKFSNEENETLYFANDEKQIIYSVAMIPNKMIFRKNVKGEPANVFYTSETIEKFQQNYFRKNANSGTNINHAEFNTDGIYPFENWIVQNSEVDKSKELGLSAPNGSLVMGFKIDNPTVWNEVKNGNLDGLSVEGKVIFKEVEPIININMNTEKNPQTLWDTLKAFFASDVAPTEEEKDKEVEMAEVPAIEVEVEDEVDYKAENEMLKEKVAELEAKLATIEADKVKTETELETMKSQKDALAIEFQMFKKDLPAVAPIANLPVEKFNTEVKEGMTAFEKFRAHNKKFKK
jgi:hypothetical protein